MVLEYLLYHLIIHQHNALPNGLIVLKGGDLNAEIRPFRHAAEVTDLYSIFRTDWFKEKRAIYLPL